MITKPTDLTQTNPHLYTAEDLAQQATFEAAVSAGKVTSIVPRPLQTTPHITTSADLAQQEKFNQLIAQGYTQAEAAAACGGVGAMPTIGGGGTINLGSPVVTPAPAYQKTPEQQAWEDMYSGKVTDWVQAGGYGIPEETKTAMIQQQTDSLKSLETENIRVMRNNMERRGLTNSGFIFSNEQKIRANTTTAIAKSVTDINIQSSLMKMASFEKALGAAGEYLGYLSTQSQLENAPGMATWNAQQQANLTAFTVNAQATLTQYQAQMDIYKTNLVEAYHKQDMQAQYLIDKQLQDYRITGEKEIAMMTIEANAAAAKVQGQYALLGALSGGLTRLIKV